MGFGSFFSGVVDTVKGIAKPLIDDVLPVLSDVTDFASPFLSAYGESSANAKNVALSREQMAFQKEENALQRQFQSDQVAQQMGFQRDMSNTAVQRYRQDLAAAGINPILAYGGQGASTPSGASASGSTASGSLAHVSNALGAGISTALQKRQIDASVKQMEENNKKIRADTETAQAMTDNLRSSSDLNHFKMYTEDALRDKAIADAAASRHSARNMAVQNQLLGYQLPTAKLQADFDSSALASANKYLNGAKPVASSAKSLIGVVKQLMK
jgi:hypothetical protein